MPSLNSGTERPYAPLLEPCIILPSQYCAVGIYPSNRVCWEGELNKKQTGLLLKNALLYCKDASFTGAVTSKKVTGVRNGLVEHNIMRRL